MANPYGPTEGTLPTRQDPLTMLMQAAAPGARTPLTAGNPTPGKSGVMIPPDSSPGFMGGIRERGMRGSTVAQLEAELSMMYDKLAESMRRCHGGDQHACGQVDAMQMQIGRKREELAMARDKEEKMEAARSGPSSSTSAAGGGGRGQGSGAGGFFSRFEERYGRPAALPHGGPGRAPSF